MIDKKVNVSIDKISLVATFDDSLVNGNYYLFFDSILKHNAVVRSKVKQVFVNNQDFQYSYMIDGLGFLQYGNKLKIRLEFNPNNLLLFAKDIISNILKYCYDIHFTRLDVAIDLYNYKLEEYNIIDLSSRKKAYYYNRVGEIETVYLGSLKSGKFIRIYNKAVEQKEFGKDWWRLELQLRDVYIDKYLNGLESFFDGIYIFKYVNLDKYDIYTKSVLNYILSDISRLYEISKNSRKKYKDILKSLELDSLSFVNDIFHESRFKIIEYLNYLSDGTMYLKNKKEKAL